MTQSLESMAEAMDAPIGSFAPAEEQAPIMEDVQEVVETAPIEEVAGQFSESESEARKLGWKPEEEWKGDKQGWQPADSFLEAKKDSIKTLKNTLDRQEQAMQSLLKHTQRQEQFQQEQIKRAQQDAYAQAKADTEARLAEAYRNGDAAAIQQLKTAEESIIRASEAAKYQAPSPEQDPVVTQWKTKNDWYGKDRAMTVIADDVCARNQNLSYSEQLALVEKELRAEMPYKFQQQQRIANNMTLATQQKTVVKKAAAPNSFEALTPEWRKEADKFVAAAARHQPKEKAMAEYLKYLPPEAFTN